MTRMSMLMNLLLAPRGGFTYLLRDEFLTDAAAPLTSPRTCEPGPGTLTLVDTANHASINGAAYFTDGVDSGGDPGFYGGEIYERESCLIWLQCGALPSRNIAGLWKGNFNFATNCCHGFYNNFGNHLVYVDGGAAIDIANPAAAPSAYAVVVRRTGAWYFWRVNGAWELAHTDDTTTSGALFPGFWSIAGSVSFDKVIVARTRSVSAAKAPPILERIYAVGYEADSITLSGVLTAFNDALTGGAVGVYRSGNDYWIWQELDAAGNRYLHLKLDEITTASPAATVNALNDALIRDGKTAAGALLETIQSGSSVWEYVLHDGDWIGNGHGRDDQTALTVHVDTVLQALGDGDSAEGVASVVVTRTTEWLDAASNKLADCITTYTLTPAGGLKVEVDVTFTDTFVNGGGYDGMAPFAEVLDQGSWVGAKREYALTNDDGSTYGYDATNAIYALEDAGHYALLFYTSDGRDGGGSIQDRSGGSLNKIYHGTDVATYEATDTLSWENTYRIAYLADVSVLQR